MYRCKKGGTPALCCARHKQPMEGSGWARVGLAVATCSHLSTGENSPYFTVYSHLCLQVNWDEVEGLAGPKLYTLQSGNKSNPAFPLLSAGPRSCAASVESLQQTMNYGWNEKSQPGAQREYAKCRAITFVCEPRFVPPSLVWGPKHSSLLWAATASAHRAQDSLLPRAVGSEIIFINLKSTSSCLMGSSWELLRVLCGWAVWNSRAEGQASGRMGVWERITLGISVTVQILLQGCSWAHPHTFAGEVMQEFPPRLALRAEPGTAFPHAEEPWGSAEATAPTRAPCPWSKVLEKCLTASDFKTLWFGEAQSLYSWLLLQREDAFQEAFFKCILIFKCFSSSLANPALLLCTI